MFINNYSFFNANSLTEILRRSADPEHHVGKGEGTPKIFEAEDLILVTHQKFFQNFSFRGGGTSKIFRIYELFWGN